MFITGSCIHVGYLHISITSQSGPAIYQRTDFSSPQVRSRRSAWRTSELRLAVSLRALCATWNDNVSFARIDRRRKEFQSHKFVVARDKFTHEIRPAKSCDVYHSFAEDTSRGFPTIFVLVVFYD